MTPKEKAKSLIKKHLKSYDIDPIAIKASIITANEIRHLMNKLQNYEEAVFWKEVKHELENRYENL
jgi:hypothetical protein